MIPAQTFLQRRRNVDHFDPEQGNMAQSRPPVDLDALLLSGLRLDPRQLRDDLTYGDVDTWDSLTHIDLMLVLEESYGVQIDEDRMLQLTSVGAIRAFVHGLRG